MSEPKPRGSGYFAAICGAMFMLAFFGSFFARINQLSPEWMIRGWLLFVAVILLWWGIKRVLHGRPDSTVGQDTINLVVALVGTTFALLALLKH